MQEILKSRIEKIQNEVRELGAEKLRLEKLRENIDNGLGQIDRSVSQKSGALQELANLSKLLESEEKEKPELKKPKLVENKKSGVNGEDKRA